MRKRRLTLSQKKMINGYLFILPWLIGFIFFYIKHIMTTQFSFQSYSKPVGDISLSMWG